MLSKVAVHEDAKIVDLTHKQGTVATLMEAKIVCNFSEKVSIVSFCFVFGRGDIIQSHNSSIIFMLLFFP